MKYYYKSDNSFSSSEREEPYTKAYTDDEYKALFSGADCFHYVGLADGDDTPSLLRYDEDTCLQVARNKREEICFPVINRGSLWYKNLTDEQVSQLDEWYKAWLDVTNTFLEPKKPSWLTE